MTNGKRLEDYPPSKNDPGTPLGPGESWYFWDLGGRRGRIRIKDGKRVRFEDPILELSHQNPDDYEPTKWWKVVAPDGTLWCETSSEKEARDSMRPGDTLYRLYEKVEREWRPVEGKS